MTACNNCCVTGAFYLRAVCTRAQVKRPMVLVGTSLGSAVAVHFAREHPEAVAKLVFAGPQYYVDGIGPMSSMPRALSYLGVQVRPASCTRPPKTSSRPPDVFYGRSLPVPRKE